MKIVYLPEGADLDALSSAFGVQKIFEDAYLLKPSKLSKKAGGAFKRFKHLFRIVEDVPQEPFDLVLVDNQHLPETIKNFNDLIVYDHHPKEISNYRGKIEEVGAATTLVVEEIIQKGEDINPEEATLLALGIYEDTGNLTYEGTTPRDLKALAWLLEKGANLREIREFSLEKFTKDQIEAVSQILSSVEKFFLDGLTVAIATARLEKYQPDLNSLLYEARDLKEADAFFVIVEAEGKTYLFGRSQTPKIDAGKILSLIGGGGHPQAGALKVENVPAERLKGLLVKILMGQTVKVKVSEIMSRPPFTLSAQTPVNVALEELIKRGFANAPVVDERGKLLGVVSKKALLKVVKIYPNAKVEEFMSRDVVSLKEDAFLWEAEEILTRLGQKLIPIVRDGRVVGVITRLDLLQRMREDTAPLKTSGRKIDLPRHLKDLLKDIGAIANGKGFRAYLVGGAVRDILLGKEVWDVDVVVEGDAIDVARSFAEKYGVNLHPFDEFGTAHIKVKGVKIEFATARRESYPAPGSYPQVERASLKEDLFRRDFTINAMALSLNEGDFGTLIDLFGGLKDLKEGIIRVIHTVSFVEDPVRILRALRFAGRFGFRLSKNTEKLMKSAIEKGLLKNAPVGRVSNEIRLALREDRLLEILRLYKKFRIFENLFEGFSWDRDLEDRLEKLKRVVNWHSLEFPQERPDYGWIYMVLILSKLEKSKGLKILSSLSAPAWARETYTFLKERFNSTVQKLRTATRPSQVYFDLKGLRIGELLLLMTVEDISQKVRIFLEKLRKVKVPPEEVERLKAKGLKGKDLGKALEEIKASIMDKADHNLLPTGGLSL